MAVSQNFPSIAPSLTLNFASSRTLDPRITFTRTTTATCVGPNGLLKTVPADSPRFDHDPTTGESLGLLVEEQRTNHIRNNTMVGAVAGTPGTLPTNWSGAGSEYGITREIAGTGVDNGIHYFDFRLSGTASSNYIAFYAAEAANSISATQNDVWTSSVYTKLQSGSLSGVSSILLRLDEINSSSAFISGAVETITPTSADLIGQRTTVTKTFSDPSVAYAFSGIRIQIDSGSTVDFTLRIGLPQLEKGAFATSVIPTTTSAVTRAADVASITGSNFSSWANASEGTLYADVTGYMNDALAGQRTVAAISDGTYSNNFALSKSSGGNAWRADAFSGGGSSQATFTGPYVAGVSSKIAFGYALNNANASFNGSVNATDTSVNPPVSPNRLDFRDPTGASAGHPTVTIKRLTYWPVRLGNSTLQQITQ